MDIGRPNNFPRILNLYGDDYDAVSKVCWGASFSDEETERHMRRVFTDTGYVMCPHTAVGHLAMDAFAKDVDLDFIKVTVGTAHPAKFAESVERIIREDVPLPAPLAKAMKKKKRVSPSSRSIKSFGKTLAMIAWTLSRNGKVILIRTDMPSARPTLFHWRAKPLAKL